MIYQTGTVANVSVLLTTLQTFLTTTAGYTVNLAPTVQGLGFRAHYQVVTPNGNTLFTNFRSFRKENGPNIFSPTVVNDNAAWSQIDGLAMNLSKAYTGVGAVWDQQGGQPMSGNLTTQQGCAVYAGALDNIPAYHFFYNANPHMIVVVLEWNLGFYSYLIWGEPDPIGAGVFNPNNGYFYMGSTVWNYCFNLNNVGSVVPDPNGLYTGLQGPMWYIQFYSIGTTFWRQQNQFFQLDPALHNGANGWLGPADDITPMSNVNTTGDGTGDNTNQSGLVTPLMQQDTSPYKRVPKYLPNHKGRMSRRTSNLQTGVAVFLPHYFFWQPGQNNSVFLGQMKDVYNVYGRDLIPGQTITLGADNWIFFPYNTKPNPFDPDFNVSGRSSNTYGMGMMVKAN